MAKVYKLVDHGQPGTSHNLPTDWSKCILCQEDKTEVLRCPVESTRDKQGAGYTTIADLLLDFSKIGCLPRSLNLSRLDDGEGIEATLKQNKAKWHDSCRLRYNKTQLRRAEKRKRPIEHAAETTKKFTRRSLEQTGPSSEACFFCGKPAPAGGTLRRASTFGIDVHIRQCAMKLQDKQLLAKLSAGDLIAQDAQYHVQCLVSLYNRARETKPSDNFDVYTVNEGIAFAELVYYIEDSRMDALVAPVFKLTDLVNLYSTRLKQLGTDVVGRIHSTKLKDRILSYFPDMEAHKKGRDVVLIFNADIGSALSKACEHDSDNDAVHLARAANVVRRDMFKMKNQFSGSFGTKCQEESVPVSLLALVAMVINGPNIEAQSSSSAMPQPVLTISQLLMYNSLVRRRKNQATSTIRHNQERETPLPIYLGVMVHTKTRKRELVDTLHELGLSVSYDRVMDISTELGNKICSHYQREKAVCPPELKCGLFTTAAVDNIDHSTSAHDAFHGTGHSLFQHPDSDSGGVARAVTTTHGDPASTNRTIACLPEIYTSIPPATLTRVDPPLPKHEGPNKSDCHLISQAMQEEYGWLENLKQILHACTLLGDEMISWSAYHASHQTAPTEDSDVALSSMLPLFHNQAKSVAMIRHSMDIVKTAVGILNPGQVPVIACDQPLYTLAKQIQWSWPSTHGEKHFVVMFGGLHIEMAALNTLGDLQEGSGWTGALVQAGVATPGTADSFLKAAHVTRTRRAHQVTASSLYLLLQKAYGEYTEDATDVMSLEDWTTEKTAACPHFQFWNIILQLELTVMLFVRSIREGNFQLYIEALTKIVPWFFALDHIHYSRWIPVQLRDMVSLQECHHDVYEEFMKGKFTVKKTKHAFSAIAIDQAHEQNNASVKGDGGAVGLTENPAALCRWMVSGPEMARVIGDFEFSTKKRQDKDWRHHEQKKHVQMAFARDVKALSGAMEEMGNPFSESSSDLLVLDSRNIADTAVADMVRQINKLGHDQYQAYVEERLVNQTKPITDPLKRNNLPLFSRPPIKAKSSKHLQLSTLKNNCSLFSRLYIASQVRSGDLDEFFQHENQACPPALSQMGVLRSGTVSDLLSCLHELMPLSESVTSPTVQVTCTILDGAAIVNMLRPGTAKTFQDYANDIFLPYITSQLQHVTRLDIVWDEYMPGSLKADARSKRGKGVRRRVEQSSTVPGNWQAFLHIDENKTELFSFLAMRAAGIDTSKQVITTHHVDVLCINQHDVSSLASCTHEEADTRMLLHLEDAVRQGHSKVSIRTVDTDVVVLAITAAQRLNISELWVAFGVGKSFRFLAAHKLARALGPDWCVALPMFHAFTGCDTVSFFGGRGKRTAWDTWKAYKDVTPAFCALVSTPTLQTIKEWLGQLERFVVLLYDRTSSQQSVNEVRKQLFTQKGRSIDGIPPTQAALIQHIKRATYQAGHCWAQMMIAAPELPSPSEWGWSKKAEGGWEVCWTTLPEATQACRELIRCGCKKSCRGRCKCQKAALQCTALCLCGGLCTD